MLMVSTHACAASSLDEVLEVEEVLDVELVVDVLEVELVVGDVDVAPPEPPAPPTWS
jgi:hypothetical protein